ncbi:galactose oxidase [Gigaspora margarita]|uniref:Galactose oxidase n=1 Tax=Gigaspora margarita TaxID=4874 RepID=A0A8H3XJN8_GIGMA|nr:galactose oxidase [Gigaspora margarita]
MAANRSNQVSNEEEDSPTDTTNPAFPDESPTLPPDNSVNEDPRLSISPNNAGPSSITSPTTTPPSHNNPYNNPSSPAHLSSRIVNSQQTSSSNQPNHRGPTPVGSQSPIVTVSTTTRRFHTHHHGDRRRNPQGEPHIPQAPPVPPAPAPSMYWSKIRTHGKIPKALRAHTVNLVGELMYVFGGCDSRTCFNSIYIFDADTMYWSKPRTIGDPPPSCRAHSSTLVDKKLFIFGGGDGPEYFNDLYVFDTDTLTWTKPKTTGNIPSRRRAHTTAYYNNCIYVFGGGDGVRALNDVYKLNISDMNNLVWEKLETTGRPPISRGYHTSNLVGNKLVVYGGSDGHECFDDVFMLDLERNNWIKVNIANSRQRLSHTATQVGSYLFIVCGHDGVRYTSEVLLLNLVTMQWEVRKVYGTPPSGRGYHTTILYDSRLFVFGGYDGHSVFDDVYCLDLSACAYLPQITNFQLPEF